MLWGWCFGGGTVSRIPYPYPVSGHCILHWLWLGVNTVSRIPYPHPVFGGHWGVSRIPYSVSVSRIGALGCEPYPVFRIRIPYWGIGPRAVSRIPYPYPVFVGYGFPPGNQLFLSCKVAPSPSPLPCEERIGGVAARPIAGGRCATDRWVSCDDTQTSQCFFISP